MSTLERLTDTLARSIANLVVQRAHPLNRDWALAMSAEMDAISRPVSRLRWAASSLGLLGAPAPAGGPRYFGSLARNLLAFTLFMAALRCGMMLVADSRENWVVTSSVIGAATLVWWMISLTLRATFMSYASAGQAVFGIVTLAAHLTFGIESVQGGEIYFSIMGTATLAAVAVARQRSRGADLKLCLFVALGCAVLNVALWMLPFGVGRFGLLSNQITIVTSALLGAATGMINVAWLGPDRPLTRVAEF
jgi:hypothetical protein